MKYPPSQLAAKLSYDGGRKGLIVSHLDFLNVTKQKSSKWSFNSNDGYARAPGCSEQLNFAAAPSEDEADYTGHYLKKGKVTRQDPMSHRIIEKRRRDRMNNCLADLSRLIPPEYLKKGRGRVEKTEIIEMAIRHLKYLQERAHGLYLANKGASDAAERTAGAEHFRAGYHEASTEAVRFLVEVQGYGPSDGLCVQLASHLQMHSPLNSKGEPLSDKRPGGSSSETGSSSSLSHGYAPTGVIARLVKPPEPYQEPYEPAPEAYPMECDRVSETAITLAAEEDFTQSGEPLLLEAHPKREQTLRTVRKSDYADDYLHSYKFKNSIERRFSRSQDSEAHDMTVNAAPREPTKTLHKRRRAAKPAPSTTTSNSGSTEDARDTSPQDTSSESPHHHYEKPLPTQFVPVFALNALGKYYVPVSVDYACLSRHLGPFDVLDARAAHLAAPLHPVTIHVNFQPCLNYHVKNERDWAAA